MASAQEPLYIAHKEVHDRRDADPAVALAEGYPSQPAMRTSRRRPRAAIAASI
jgi:hypothetical protein